MTLGRRKAIFGAAAGLVATVAMLAPSATAQPAGATSRAHSPDGVPLSAAQVAPVAGVSLPALLARAEQCRHSGNCLGSAQGAMLLQALPARNPELRSEGRPEIVYIGAEYCPFCAGERWVFLMALSKFGRFSGLSAIASSSSDVDPSTPSVSFYGATYTSKYVAFVADEQQTSGGQPLQAPTALERRLVTKWDTPPYTSGSGGIPFAYVAGKYVLNGVQFDPSPLSGARWSVVASEMAAGKAAVARHAQAAAGFLVADICTLTRGSPAAVCRRVRRDLLGIAAKPQG